MERCQKTAWLSARDCVYLAEEKMVIELFVKVLLPCQDVHTALSHFGLLCPTSLLPLQSEWQLETWDAGESDRCCLIYQKSELNLCGRPRGMASTTLSGMRGTL